MQSEETEARIFEAALKDFADNPMSGDAVQKLGGLLRKQGTAASEEEAIAVFTTGFERTKEYRFKMAAGEIRLNQLRRKMAAALNASQCGSSDSCW